MASNKKRSSGKNSTSAKNTDSNKNPNSGKKKKGGARLVISVVLFIALTVGYVVSLSFQDKIDDKFGLRKVEFFSAGDLVSIGSMDIHFIDVGQGDSCLIELPDGKTVLIDAGDNKKEVREKLAAYIDKVNDDRAEQNTPTRPRPQIEYFDYVIATHSHDDHIGSMPYILGLYPVRTFFRPNEKATYGGYTDPALNGENEYNRFRREGNGVSAGKRYKETIEAAYSSDGFVEGVVINPFGDYNRITPTTEGAQYKQGGDLYYEINFYGPVSAEYTNSKGEHQPNDYSAILVAEYQGRRVALSGDSESAGEGDFAEAVSASTSGTHFYPLSQPSFYVDVLKLGHHGSYTSNSAAFLAIMTAQNKIDEIFVVISCGFGNSYGHPHDAVMTRIADLGIKEANILRTDHEDALINDVFLAFNYYEGIERALVEEESGGDRTIITYPREFFGFAIRYSLIALFALVVIALILVAINYSAIKKHIPKAKKAVKKNNNRK